MTTYNLRASVFIFTFLSVLCFGLLIISFEAFTLMLLSILFLGLLFFALFSNGLVTKTFFIFLTFSHITGLWVLYFNQDIYTYSGWTAIKAFNFSGEQFASIFFPVVLMYFLMILLLNFLDIFLFKSRKNTNIRLNSKATPSKNLKRSVKFNIIILCLVFSMIPLHDFMFSNMIAVTGQSHLQNPLPYNIGGILFYFTKILIPLIIIILYFRARTSFILLSILLAYATFVGLTQMSRSSLFMLILPLLLIHLYRKEYIYVFISGLFLVFSGVLLSYIRDISTELNIFEIIKGQSFLQLTNIIFSEISNYELDLKIIIDNIIGMLSRFGGGQDVVLASQYSLDATGGLTANIARIFFGDLTYAGPASWHLYDFVPLMGQGVGYGSISAQLVQVTQGNYFLKVLVIMFLSILIKLFDYLVIKIKNSSKINSIEFILCAPIMLLIFLYSSFILLYGYLALLIFLHYLFKFKFTYRDSAEI